MIRRGPVSVAALAALAMLTGCASSPANVAEPVARTDIFAYATSTELVVADGTAIVSRTPGTFDTTRDVGVTKDAKFAFGRKIRRTDRSSRQYPQEHTPSLFGCPVVAVRSYRSVEAP